MDLAWAQPVRTSGLHQFGAIAVIDIQAPKGAADILGCPADIDRQPPDIEQSEVQAIIDPHHGIAPHREAPIPEKDTRSTRSGIALSTPPGQP